MGVYSISQLCNLPAKFKETSGSRGKGEAVWGVEWPTPEPDLAVPGRKRLSLLRFRAIFHRASPSYEHFLEPRGGDGYGVSGTGVLRHQTPGVAK